MVNNEITMQDLITYEGEEEYGNVLEDLYLYDHGNHEYSIPRREVLEEKYSG